MNLKSRNKDASEKNSANGLFLTNLQVNIAMGFFKRRFSNLGYLINLKKTLTDVLYTIPQLWIYVSNGPKPQYQPVRAKVNKFL